MTIGPMKFPLKSTSKVETSRPVPVSLIAMKLCLPPSPSSALTVILAPG